MNKKHSRSPGTNVQVSGVLFHYLATVQEELLADGAQHLAECGHCHIRGDLLLDGVLLLDQLLQLVILHCVHHGDESFHVVHSPFKVGYIRMLIGIEFIMRQHQDPDQLRTGAQVREQSRQLCTSQGRNIQPSRRKVK